MRHEALRWIDRDRGDFFRRVVRNVFDIHAAFGRNDHGHAAAGAVDQHREVIFFGNIDAVGDIQAVDLLAFIAGLDGDQRVAEHFLGIGCDIVDALGQANAALGIGAQFLELALAASASVDLRLHDIQRPGQFLGACNRFFNGQRGMTGRNADAVFREQFLGLIFVDVHEASNA